MPPPFTVETGDTAVLLATFDNQGNLIIKGGLITGGVPSGGVLTAPPNATGVVPAPGAGMVVTAPAATGADGLDIRDSGAGRSGNGQLFQVFDHLNNPIFSIPAAGGPAVYGDQLRAGGSVFGPFVALDGVNQALLFPGGGRLFDGSGAPSGTLAGSNTGDYYFRTDTPSTANQRIYVKTAATTWTGIV